MKNKLVFLFVALLLVLAFTGCTAAAPAVEESSEAVTTEVVSESEFPMLADAANVVATEGTVLYQSATPLADAFTFYQTEFTTLGLVQNETLTLQDDTMFQLVFTGSENGLSLIVQTTKLDDTNINVSIRYE